MVLLERGMILFAPYFLVSCNGAQEVNINSLVHFLPDRTGIPAKYDCIEIKFKQQTNNTIAYFTN